MALRVGIVGWGEIARMHARHLEAAGARVSAIVARRKLDLDLPVFDSLSDMLPCVDAVTIAVPNHLHAPLCAEAVAAGKAVFVEKPVCIDRRQLALLEKTLRPKGPALRVGYRLRWNPAMREMRQKLTGVDSIRCIYRQDLNHLARGKPWTRSPAQSGGAWFTLGIHALDLARWMVGAQGEPLRGLCAKAIPNRKDEDFPLCVELRGTLPNGTELMAGVDLAADVPFELDLRVEPSRVGVTREALQQPWPEGESSGDLEYGAMMADFVEAATGGCAQDNQVAEILQTHRELLRARELSR